MCEGEGWSEKLFFLFSRRRKEAVYVLRLPCDSGSCLLAGASIPAQLDWGATLPGAGTRASEYRGGPQAATRPAARGQQCLPRPGARAPHLAREPVPAEPHCGPLRGPVRGFASANWLCVSMLNLLISWVVWTRTVNYPVAWPPNWRTIPGNFRVGKGNFVCNFVLLKVRLFPLKPSAKCNCILRSWIQDSHFEQFFLTTSKLQLPGSEVRVWWDSGGNLYTVAN